MSTPALASGPHPGTVTRLALAPLPAPEATERTDLAHTELARTVLGELADSARATAHAQGYAVGWAQGSREARVAAAAAAAEAERGRQEAEQRREREHADAVRALRQAANQVRGLLTELCTALEEQSTDLAWALTETLVGREVSVASGADVVRRVLEVLPAAPVATVRLHPELAADPAVRDLVARGLDVVADPGMGRADALVESDGAVTDLRISAAMGRVREVLR